MCCPFEGRARAIQQHVSRVSACLPVYFLALHHHLALKAKADKEKANEGVVRCSFLDWMFTLLGFHHVIRFEV
jgi:hypothetical protein